MTAATFEAQMPRCWVCVAALRADTRGTGITCTFNVLSANMTVSLLYPLRSISCRMVTNP